MPEDLPEPRWGRRYADVIVAWEPVNRRVLARLEGAQTARTQSFAVFRGRSTTLVVHRVAREAVDNDIGQRVADELIRPGLVPGPNAFERCFAGLVESTDPSAQAAWRRFYVNTLIALRGGGNRPTTDAPIATFAQIYRHAERLARGHSVLDIGSCFAFFPMLLAGRGELRVTASDVHAPTVALARRMAAELALPVAFKTADVTRQSSLPTASFDTVTALHVLEHLPPDRTLAALEELCRTSVRRVVVAVPLEPTPDSVFGHQQTFDMPRLSSLADAVPGWRGQAHEHLGGWLVLEPRTRRPGPWPVEASAAERALGRAWSRTGWLASRTRGLPHDPRRPLPRSVGWRVESTRVEDRPNLCTGAGCPEARGVRGGR
jgi:2-polyprenyl-3-methyl-5-hydroxy-6-metoxy-1,4-benzoquinol methylase